MPVEQSHFRHELIEQFPFLDPARGVYRWLVLASVMVGTFMAVLDSTIVTVALPKLMAVFGVSVDSVEWVLTAYLLIFAVMLTSSGWLADRFGYKTMFIVGLFLFTLGSFLCSLAGSFSVLIAFRVLQGAGAAFLLSIGIPLITREFPPRMRGVALGFWSVSASASVSLGPTFGGYLIDRYDWNVIFDVNVPVGLMGMIAAWIILREHRPAPGAKFDFVGFLSLSIGLTALLIALSDGNSAWNTAGWTSTFILTSFFIAFVGLGVFLATELIVEHPLIDIGLFENFNFSVSNVVFFTFGLGMFGANFLLPIYLQNSLNYTPFQAGLVFLPVGIMLGISAPLAGIFTDRYDARVPLVFGLAVMALSMYQFSSLSLLSEHWQIMLPLYLRGIGMGCLFTTLTTVAISEIPNRRMAQASGLINVIRQVGGSFGVAIFGTVLTRRTIFHMAMYGQQINPASAIYTKTVRALSHFAMSAVGGTYGSGTARAKALVAMHVQQEAFVSAVDDVFWLAFIVLAFTILPVFFLRRHHDLHRGEGGGALPE